MRLPAWLCVAVVCLLLAPAGSRADEPPATPGEVRLPLVYRGRMGDVAVLEDLETTAQTNYRRGDQVRGATVVDIQPTELVLEVAGRRVTLILGDTTFAEGQLAVGEGVGPCPWLVPVWAEETQAIIERTRVDLEFASASIEDVASQLRRFTQLSLLVDPEAQVRGKGPFSLDLKGVTVHTALTQTLPQLGLDFAFQDKSVVITTAARAAENPIRRAQAAQRLIAEARLLLDGGRPEPPSVPAPDAALVRALDSVRLTATFDDAALSKVVEFLHATAGIGVLVAREFVDPEAESLRVSLGVKGALLRELLDEITRPRDLAWEVRGSFLVITSIAAVEARQEREETEREAAAAREEQEAGVLETALAFQCTAEPLCLAARRITEQTGVPIVVAPELWGPIPKVTWSGGKTLVDFLEALDTANGVRYLALRGSIILVR